MKAVVAWIGFITFIALWAMSELPSGRYIPPSDPDWGYILKAPADGSTAGRDFAEFLKGTQGIGNATGTSRNITGTDGGKRKCR